MNLVQAGRSFQRQGSLKKKSQKNGNDRRFEFFLFNDLLVFAEMSGLTLSIKSLKVRRRSVAPSRPFIDCLHSSLLLVFTLSAGQGPVQAAGKDPDRPQL